MEIIHYINGLRAREIRGQKDSLLADERTKRADEWHNIEKRLTHLVQKTDPAVKNQLPYSERTRILITAELYRLATILYLQRTSISPQANEMRSIYLQQAFKVLGSLEVCTSPVSRSRSFAVVPA